MAKAPPQKKAIDWVYWNGLYLWQVDEACRLIYRENPAEPTRPADIENPDTLARPAWVNLFHTAMSAIGAGKLKHSNYGVKPQDFLTWAANVKGITIPDAIRPSAGSAPDNEPIAKRKAPDAFIAALIRLLTEISRRAAEKGMPFGITAMPETKSDFMALAEKFDGELEKAPRTFDDYLAGLVQFRQGVRETTFYQELFPEFFRSRGPDT